LLRELPARRVPRPDGRRRPRPRGRRCRRPPRPCLRAQVHRSRRPRASDPCLRGRRVTAARGTPMAAMLTVIWWRDIPAQIVAKDRRQSHKIVLHPRFQVAIDRAAKEAGLSEWGAYLEQWRKEQRICGDDVKAEAEAEALRLETDYSKGA